MLAAGCGGGGPDSSTQPSPLVNVALIASAQASTTAARSADLITLDATGSRDTDGSIASYEWARLAGASITLSADDDGATNSAELDIALSAADVRLEADVADGAGFIVDDASAIGVARNASLEAATHSLTLIADCGDYGTVREQFELPVLPRPPEIPTFQAMSACEYTALMTVVAVAHVPTVDGRGTTGPWGRNGEH